MAEPRISVLVTSYNRADTIAAAIESVLAGRFGDFELLVVDDRSIDASVEIARGYERLDSRVRVTVNEVNLGDYRNRNRAATLARAPYLKYHDSDDVMYPHCLTTLYEPLAAEPRAGFALSTGGTWAGGPCPMLSTPLLSYRREFLGIGMFNVGPACALFRTEVFHRLGGFEDRGVASDFVFWLRACRQVDVLLVPGDLFWYRIHAGQELQSPRAAASYARADGEVWRALNAPDCPLAGAELEQARRNWVWNLTRSLRADLKARRFANARLRFAGCGLAAGDWLRYLRRGRRSWGAGTPLDERGDFLIPGWVRPAGLADPGKEK